MNHKQEMHFTWLSAPGHRSVTKILLESIFPELNDHLDELPNPVRMHLSLFSYWKRESGLSTSQGCRGYSVELTQVCPDFVRSGCMPSSTQLAYNRDVVWHAAPQKCKRPCDPADRDKILLLFNSSL